MEHLEHQSTAVTPHAVASIVGAGGFWSRAAIARALGRKKTSHVIRVIELAVSLGFINRRSYHDGVREGFIYTTEPESF